jgi:parallel beta-helix repeat protein
MYNMYTSSPNVTNCTFSGNTATGGAGGGMYNTGSSPTVTNCTFSGNEAYTGGGMRNYYRSSPAVTDCTFSRNSAICGGGMYNASSNPTVTNCTFSGNTATDGAGGMFNTDSSPTITNCTFAGNAAALHGGGMDNSLQSSPKVTNCTFSGNSANSEGGGMCNFDESNPTVTNCIFWGDTQEEIDGSATVTYSIVQGGSVYTGEGNRNADPLLEPLHYNGGATQTCTIPANSPARNNGSWDANLWESISLDQRGVSRDIVSPDMGAYECSPDLKILTLTLEGSGTVTCNPEGTPFGSWGNQWCYDPGGAGGGLFSSMANRTDGSSSVIFTESPDFPWTFTEWSGDISGTENTATVTMEKDRWVLAIFTRQCGIAASAGTGGTIAPSGNVTVLSGNDQTFAVTPDNGYEVKDVTVDGEGV